MANLIEGIQKECNRLRDTVLPEYDKIPEGIFAATIMRDAITRAEAAIASGDVVACVESYKELQGFNL